MYGQVMDALLEHWVSRDSGMGRRELQLLRDERYWKVHIRLGGNEMTKHYDDEPSARSQLDLLLSERGPWKLLD